jgi:pyruvate,water dikinase
MLTHRPRPPATAAGDQERGARVVALDGTGRSVEHVGGKGAWLDRLVCLGFPVPPAVALTTGAYLETIRHHPPLASLLADLRRSPVPAPREMDAARERVTNAFRAAPLPDGIEATLSSVEWLASDGGPGLAVRSSATAEDRHGSSFAGQHLTVLDVEGPEGLVDAIRLVWASLWFPAPRAYRHRMGVREDDLAMAVVLQRMVPADESGVCFTRDPAHPGTVRVESVEGLGEALVSGQVVPEVHRYRRAGVTPLDAAPDHPTTQVARLALAVEEELGAGPVDLEWSRADGRLWVLQARPAAPGPPEEGDGFDTPGQEGHRYSPVGVAEMLPGVLTPLAWTVNGPMVEEAFRRRLAELGALPDGLASPFGVVARIRGRAALDLTLLTAAVEQVGGDASDVERQYLGTPAEPVGPPRPSGVARPGRRQVTDAFRSVRASRLSRRWAGEAEAFLLAAARVVELDVDFPSMRSSELLAYRARLRSLAAGGVAAEVGTAISAVGAYGALERTLAGWVQDDAAELAQRLTSGAVATASAGPGVAHRVRLRRLACTSVYAGPTWEEEGTSPPVLAGRIAENQAVDALAALERSTTRRWRWRVRRVLTGQAVDIRRRALRRQVAATRHLLALRELSKEALLAVGGIERRLTLELADRLVRRGTLAAPEDVELLADWELEGVVARVAGPSAAALARRRRSIAQWRRDPDLPALVDWRGRDIDTRAVTGGLVGWGASPGVHRGRTRTIRQVADGADLAPGEVLVAVATDPSWTPLFAVAGAIVVERGGPLSHAAIVAREFGLPAVLNVRGAVDRLPDGTEVEVDGTSGTVRVLEVDLREEAIA